MHKWGFKRVGLGWGRTSVFSRKKTFLVIPLREGMCTSSKASMQTRFFFFVSSVFQSYLDDGRTILKDWAFS